MKKNLLSALFFCCINFCYAQSGMPDPSFGINGIVKTDIGSPFKYNSSSSQVLTKSDGSVYVILNYPTCISKRFPDGSIDSAYGIGGYSSSLPLLDIYAALQPDGQIVVAGSFASNGAFYIARIGTNGKVDSTFGINGIQNTVSFGGGSYTTSVAIQNDGKILLVGSINGAGFCVFRFTSDGTPDSSFNGTSQAIITFENKVPPGKGGGDSTIYPSGTAFTVAVQSDGKIVIGGSPDFEVTGETFAIARLNINGTPDSTFDNDGRQTTITNPYHFIGYSLAIQNDGKIVLTRTGELTTIVRYNTNGSLDNSFNGNGKQIANLLSERQICNSLAIQNDGKILVAGYTPNGANNDFAVARFNTNGTPDNSFNNDGILTTDINSSDDYGGSVAIQGDGKILVAGYSNYSNPNSQQLDVLRYNTAGGLDSSFDNDGKLDGGFNQGNTRFYASVIQTDGKIIAAGGTWNGSNYDFTIVRYKTNGGLDSTFSNDGKQTTDFGATDEAIAVVVQTDGKIIAAGNTGNVNGSHFAIARYNTNGSPDNTFNGNGKLVASIGLADVCQSVALQADGKIVMVGYASPDPYFDSAYFAIARFNTNGTPDHTFSGDGKQLTDFNSSYSFAASVAIQNDGKIVAGGRSLINNLENFSLARYNIDGSLDLSFSQDGKQNNTFGPDGYSGVSLAIQTDGKIVMAGSTVSSTSFAVARYKANGDLDSTFNGDGFQSTDLGPHFNYARSVAIDHTGRIAVGGTNDNFTIVLYKSDGSLDSTFGNNGIQISKIGVGESSIRSLAFAGDKLYAAGDGKFPGNFGVIARYLPGPEGGPAVSAFTTTANGDWNDPNTWIGGVVPYATSEVIVRHHVTITTNTTCYSLKVETPGANLVVANGVKLTITH